MYSSSTFVGFEAFLYLLTSMPMKHGQNVFLRIAEFYYPEFVLVLLTTRFCDSSSLMSFGVMSFRVDKLLCYQWRQQVRSQWGQLQTSVFLYMQRILVQQMATLQ
jgi:hypothetical protein